MPDNRPAYEMAAPSIRPYVQPLYHGALPIPFQTTDEDGRAISLADDFLSGQHLLLVFLGDPASDQNAPLLRAVGELAERFEAANARALAITASTNAAANRALKRESGFPWSVASDARGGIFASYGLFKGTDLTNRLVLLTPYRQVRAWFDIEGDAGGALATVMELMENSTTADEANWIPAHAPILTVPNVLTPEECAKLVESVETETPFMVRQPRPGEIAGNYKIPVYDRERQDRIDLIIKDQNTLAFLDGRIFERVTPMIKKAFAFDVQRREDLHIARYVGAREGVTIGHRDNVEPPGAHRRFALSMSLNDDYEGGEITFGEFSQRGYRVPAGTAMVFSSSLLHEVQETTAGVRYNLISHFF